jgi:glycosyltransferase involved in cell wall biosynthesis
MQRANNHKGCLMAILTIHATNVTGLGACQVVVSFLEAIETLETSYERMDCYVPQEGPVADYVPRTDKLRVLPFRRKGPKALSRILECMFPSWFFEIGEHLVVLGDVPLRTRRKQVVLVHQPHLQSPRVNCEVGRTAVFRIMRALTRVNAPYADRVIVQTNAMADGLRRSYRDWATRDCIRVIGQPPPSWFTLSERISWPQQDSRGLRLFYPAAGYPHKNHKIFGGLLTCNLEGLIDRVVLTIPVERFKKAPDWLSCVGPLSHAECLAEYQSADALIFPSVLESYGLPLVEAMAMGIPIVAADLPYARVLCGDEGIYFDPASPESLIESCKVLQARLRDGWRPDWSARLATMPKTWQAVAQGFIDELN